MHYLPETTRRMLEEGLSESPPESPLATGYHWQSAPLYALTLAVGLLLGLDVLLGAVGTPEWLAWRQLGGFRLALLAAVLGGARILFQTLDGLFQGRIGADLALSIACLAAILLGEPQVAALVVLIALIGESLEGYTVDRAVQALRGACDLFPAIAHRLDQGRETDVAIDTLQVADAVVVRPGERLPADGVIRRGHTVVDHSPLTGESLPVDRGVGDRVYAGTLNGPGVIEVTVGCVGAETAVGQITRLVSRAQANKAPLEREADRLARYFLPFVLGAAGLTLLAWRWRTGNWSAGWMPALAVLVVACPCPLVLATPSAVLAALAWLARQGIVIKGSAALEQLASVDTVAFDKTGTLTTGDLRVGQIVSPRLPDRELVRLAAAAGRASQHPVSRLLVTHAERDGAVLPTITHAHEEPGLGVAVELPPEEAPALPRADLSVSARDATSPSPPVMPPPVMPPPVMPPPVMPPPGSTRPTTPTTSRPPQNSAGPEPERPAQSPFAPAGVAKVWPQEDPATGPPAKPPADTHQPAAAAAAAAGSSSAPWLLLGNARWLASAGVTLSPAQLADAERVEAAGESPVHVALAWRRSGSPPPASPGESRSGERVDASGGPRLAGTPAESFDPQTLAAGEWLGCLGVTDTVRGQAGEVLRRLREDGVGEIVLLTGDRPGAARELTGQLAGLDAWHAGLLPQDKAAWVTQRQGAGRRVVMVGDGINDAPALKSASVGIAVAQAGANLAGEAGDVLLLGDPLTALPGLLRLSRALVQNIRRSITWFGFGFNALGVLLSAWGWLSPVASAVVHEVGSLAVMLHALQLLWFERGPSPTGSRVGASLAATGVWVGNWLSPSRWIYRLLRHRRKLLPLAGCLLAGWWLTRNLVLLNPDEQALVQRLGRYHETIGPGLWWRWPPPFESLRRERPERLQSLAFGFRTAPRPVTTPGDYRAPVEWQTTHEDQGYLMLPDEALLLTGDELLVELTAEAQWQITDLREYARQSSDPAAILRGLVESALREVVARKPLEDLLGANRSDWEQDCLQAAQAALARHQLGLRLVNLNLLEVHPPGGVVPSYRDVANALEEREQLLNLGQTQAARTLLATGGEPALAAFPLAPRTSRDTLPPLPGPRPATSAEAPPSSPESIPPPPGGAPLPAQPAHQSGPVAAAGLTEALWRELAADPAGDLESRDPGVGETGDVPPKGRGVSPPAEGEPGRVTPPGPASGPGATAGLDRSRLAGRAAETLHRARADRAVRQFSARGQADRFRAVQQPHAASPQLTLLHLYWESLEQTLANRPLLIVDPQAEGRRQIWLNESGLSPADLPAPPTSSPANPGDSSVPAFPRRPVLPPDDDTQ